MYVSREGEPSRAVADEPSLLLALASQLAALAPRMELVVFRGDLTLVDTIQLFQRAKARALLACACHFLLWGCGRGGVGGWAGGRDVRKLPSPHPPTPPTHPPTRPPTHPPTPPHHQPTLLPTHPPCPLPYCLPGRWCWGPTAPA